MVEGDPHLPQQLPPEAQGIRQRRKQHSHLQTGPHQTRGTPTTLSLSLSRSTIDDVT